LSGTKEDEEVTYRRLFRALVVFIRTELKLKGTSKEERKKHIQLFVHTEKKGSLNRWNEIIERLNKEAILPIEVQQKYLRYLSELEQELKNVRVWFAGTSEKIIRRLLKARIYDALLKGEECRFGFNPLKLVEVNGFNVRVEKKLSYEKSRKQREILDWILTSESDIYVKKIGERKVEYLTWEFDSIDEVVEAVYRILDEYYGYNEDSRLRDYALAVKKEKKLCFIASAVYETPFAEEIRVLRYWRDTFLQNSVIGRLFIKIYYGISPPLANYISKKEKLRSIIRKLLTLYVKFLKYVIG
jgi:hypothetical protein